EEGKQEDIERENNEMARLYEKGCRRRQRSTRVFRLGFNQGHGEVKEGHRGDGRGVQGRKQHRDSPPAPAPLLHRHDRFSLWGGLPPVKLLRPCRSRRTKNNAKAVQSRNSGGSAAARNGDSAMGLRQSSGFSERVLVTFVTDAETGRLRDCR